VWRLSWQQRKAENDGLDPYLALVLHIVPVPPGEQGGDLNVQTVLTRTIAEWDKKKRKQKNK